MSSPAVHRESGNMNFVKYAFVALLLPCSSGCNREGKNMPEQEAFRRVSAMISDIACTNNISGRKFKDFFFKVDSDISGMTNLEMKCQLTRSLSQAVKRKPDGEYSDAERVEMADAFLLPHVSAACRLFEVGASEAEVVNYILGEFRNFRRLCHPFSAEVSKENRLARDLDWYWKNGACFFERNCISTIFQNAAAGATERFLQRWHDEFGCFDYSHKGK